MTHQILIELPDEVYLPLVERAKAAGNSVESLAGALVAESMQQEIPGSRLRKWAGAFNSGVPDAGVRHDEYLGEALMDELRNRGDD
ncbi:MAG TPA: hypothetical protein VMP01_21400 [Pirellulaceae bacterium]|nr:hypothetical protein [Pirellulaceae bacterium]